MTSRNRGPLINLDEDSDRDSNPAEIIIELSDEGFQPVRRGKRILMCKTCRQSGHPAALCPTAQSQRHETSKARVRTARNRERDGNDNPGKAMWRDGQSYTFNFTFGPDFDNASDIAGEFNRPDRIGYLTDTYIEIKAPSRLGNSKFMAYVWAANDENRDAAHMMLDNWKNETVPIGSKTSLQNFDRIAPGKAQRKLAVLEDPRKKYTEDYDENELFSCFYIVPWQVKIMEPKDFLGEQAAALNTIRKDHQCFIRVYRKNDGYKFGVVGADEIQVRKACTRLQVLQYNALAEQIEFYQFYLVKPVPFQSVRPTIVQNDYYRPAILSVLDDTRLSTPKASPADLEGRVLVFGNTPIDENSKAVLCQEYAANVPDKEEQLEDAITVAGVSNSLNALYAELWFRKVFELQPYYLGSMKMRARIGTCAFGKSFADQELDLPYFRRELFNKNRLDADIDSVFTQELGNLEVEATMLDRFLDINSHLIPDVLPGEIDGKSPHACAVEYSMSKKGSNKEFGLHLSFNNLQAANGVPTWIMPEQEASESDPFFDVNFLDLHHPHLSYNLGAQWLPVLKNNELWKLELSWSKFPELLKIDPEKAKNHEGTEVMIHYPEKGGNLPITEMKQIQTWHFRLKDSDYKVDLHRIQVFDCTQNKFGTLDYVAREPRFGVEVYHPKWDTMLSQNANLSIGRKASWLPEEYAFFPAGGKAEALPGSSWERGSGIKEWLRVMKVVEDVICGVYVKRASDDEGPELEQPVADMLI